MWNQRKVIWSPVELEYLKKNINEPVSQLSISLAKSKSAVQRKIREIKNPSLSQNKKGSKSKRTNIGKRKDLGGLFLRSTWEANFCRWLKYKKIRYFYEPKSFPFFGVPGLKDIKHGTINYVPDFLIKRRGKEYWVEVKGMLPRQDKTKIRRFKKYYPEEFKKLVAVVGRPGTEADKFFKEMDVPILAYYNDLKKEYKDIIDHWE